MLDSVSVEIKLVHRNHIFGEIITDTVINPKFPLDGFLRGQQLAHLDIQTLALFGDNKVHLFLPGFAYRYGIAPAKQFHENDVLQNEVDIPHTPAKDGLTDTVICDIVFLVGC